MLNLGSITFGLAADTSGLAPAVANVQSFGDAVTKTVKAAKGGMDDITTALAKQEAAMVKALQTVQNLTNSIKNSGVSSAQQVAAIKQMESAYSDFVAVMAKSSKNPLNTLDFTRASLGFKEQLDGVKRSMQDAKSQGGDQLLSTMRGLSAAVVLMQGPFSGFAYRLQATTALMREHGVVAGSVAATLAGMAAASATIIETLGRTVIAYQSTNQALVAITGNTQVATAEFNNLIGISQQAGLSVSQLSMNYARFIASATGSGETMASANNQFKEFALIMGNLHAPTQDVNNALRAFDQALSSGRVNGQELRSLFRDMPAVFTLAQQAAKSFGTDLQDATKNGTLDAQKFIDKFLELGTQMFHIDLAKPVDTLQASLQRVQTSWFLFNKSVADAIGASDAFKTILTDIVKGLDYMTAHVDIVIGVVGALTGAIGGLLGTMALLAIFSAIGPAVTAFATAMTLATSATDLLAAAQLGLEAVLLLTPWGAIAAGIALIAGAVVGATVGFNSFKNIVAQNNLAMMDTTGLNAYVAGLETTKTQVKSVTAEILKMNAAQLLMNAHNLSDYAAKVQQMVGAYNLANSPSLDGSEAFLMGPSDKDMAEADKNLRDMTAKVNQQHQLVNQLNSLMQSTPEAKGTSNYKPKNSNVDAGLKGIYSIITAAAQAQTAMDNMWKGPANDLVVKALTDVQDKLFGLKSDKLAEVNRLLGLSPSASVKATTEALARMEIQTKLTQMTMSNFNRVWEDIKKGKAEIDAANQSLKYLQQGGDPEQMWIVEATKKANEELAKLQDGSENLRATLESLHTASGIKIFDQASVDAITKLGQSDSASALEAVKKVLNDLGYSGNTAAEAMLNFEKALGKTDDQVSRLASFLSTLKKQMYDFGTLRDQLASAHRGGNQGDILDIGYLQEAQYELRQLSKESLATVADKLNALGVAGANTTQQLANFLKQTDQMKEALKQWKQVTDDQIATWQSFSDSALSDLDKVMEGTQSFSDGIKNILKDLAHTILQAAIFDPLKNGIRNAISGAISGNSTPGGFGILDAIGSIFGMGGGGGAAVGIPEFFARGGLLQKFASGSSTGPVFGPGGPMDDKVPAMLSNGEFVVNAASTKEFLGLLMAINSGSVSHYADGGVTGYVPNYSGSVNNSPLNASRGDVIIDASIGSISLPGASMETVAALKQYVDSRDARLRAEIPYMVDNRYIDSRQRGRYRGS